MGKYDHIMAKSADVQYKVMMAQLANANEASERNRLARIAIAIKLANLDPAEKARIEIVIGEDLDLEDNAVDK